MHDRCNRPTTTVAEERFARVVNATPDDLGQTIPGRLFVGGCDDAVQWAGYHHELQHGFLMLGGGLSSQC